jgi:hypothetical protein
MHKTRPLPIPISLPARSVSPTPPVAPSRADLRVPTNPLATLAVVARVFARTERLLSEATLLARTRE